jgi:hypothetical protein
MNDTFEDRLWNALKHEAERPGHELPADRFLPRPARRVVSARRAGLGLAAAAAVGAILAVVPGGASTPAYAVETQKGGAVKITFHDALKVVHDRAQVEALETRLRAAGINVVVNASTPYLCHTKGVIRHRSGRRRVCRATLRHWAPRPRPWSATVAPFGTQPLSFAGATLRGS